ncbi:unnamed protein product [Caretta caretta]
MYRRDKSIPDRSAVDSRTPPRREAEAELTGEQRLRGREVMKLACSDITVNSIYGLSGSLLIMGLDSLLIFLSYVMILKTVLSITSQAECLKALNTCISHLCIVLLFYTPEISFTLIHRFGNSSSPFLQIFLSYVYLLVPPLMNPVVYSVKSKHLREKIIRLFVK